MNPFVTFMASTTGRIARIVAGCALILVGAVIGGAGWIAAAVGLVPLLAGIGDVCLFAPLFKAPLAGKKVRAAL